MSTSANQDQLVRVTAALAATAAAMALRWAGNAFLALVTVMTVIEWTTDLDALNLGLAVTPATFWIASWVAFKGRDRITDQFVAAGKGRRVTKSQP